MKAPLQLFLHLLQHRKLGFIIVKLPTKQALINVQQRCCWKVEMLFFFTFFDRLSINFFFLIFFFIHGSCPFLSDIPWFLYRLNLQYFLSGSHHLVTSSIHTFCEAWITSTVTSSFLTLQNLLSFWWNYLPLPLWSSVRTTVLSARQPVHPL